MTLRLIPERTVDSMFAIEVVEFVPHALVWSPTNTKGQVDHFVYGLGVRALSFECKGTVSDRTIDPAQPWKSPIDYKQLDAYLLAGFPVLYVVPAKPTHPDVPWVRTCACNPGPQGVCLACPNPKPDPDRTSRRWAAADESLMVKGAKIHYRFQPWFAHWCWVIPAGVLYRHLVAERRPWEMPTADDQLAVMQGAGAQRLCHFLTDVRDGKRGLADISVDPGVLAERLDELLPRSRSDDESDEADSTGLQFVFMSKSV